MKYYLCIVGNFEGGEQIYEECIERGLYQYFDETRQKGAVTDIEQGDILILTTNKQIKGYGIASGKSVASNRGHDEHWWTISVKDGWRLVDKVFPLPYGVFWNTVHGTKQSIVKEMDPTWAVEVLLKMKRIRQESISESAFPVHLSELAMAVNPNETWNSNGTFYRIPEIQRGLVWNATRCEVLWDSILRGIPIGAMSLRPTKDGCWEIFDGQQRANTISMGYANWPVSKEGKPISEADNKPILWIDLRAEKLQERQFAFRVTTPAHPWGYHFSNDEKTDNRLAVWEQRNAVNQLHGEWHKASTRGARPYTWELWPVTASLPVPFSVLRKFVERSPRGAAEFDGFVKHCVQHFTSCNWVRYFLSDNVEKPEEWDKIVKAIDKLSGFAIVALNGSTVHPDDLGLYFKRMNKQGVEPDDEEIQYSILKASIPSLKKWMDWPKREHDLLGWPTSRFDFGYRYMTSGSGTVMLVEKTSQLL